MDENQKDLLGILEDDGLPTEEIDNSSTGTGSTQSSGFYERGLRTSMRDHTFEILHKFRVQGKSASYFESALYILFVLQYLSVALAPTFPWSSWLTEASIGFQSVRSFGLHYVVGGTKSVVFVTFVSMLLAWALLAAWVVRQEIVTKERVGKRVRKIFVMFNAAITVISMPVTFMSANYLKCSEGIAVLSFGDYECFSLPHVAFFVASLVVLLTVCVPITWAVTMFCTPPPDKVRFTTQVSPKLVLIVVVTNVIIQTSVILLPHSLVWLVSFGIILCDVVLLQELKSLPFFNMSANAVYASLIFIRIVFAIFSVIAQIIGQETSILQDIADGIMLGIFLPIGVLGFGLMYTKQRKLVRKVLDSFEQLRHTEDASNSGLDYESESEPQFTLNVSTDEVEMATRLVMHRNAYEKTARFILEKSNENMKQNNFKLLLLYSTFMLYYSGESVGIAMASHLLVKAERQRPPVIYMFVISLRRREMEDMQGSTANLHDLHRFLTATRKKQLLAKFYIRQFWRALLRDSVNLDTMLKNIRLVDLHAKEAREMFQSLLRKFPESALVLRAYALFLEDIEHDPTASKEILQQADMLEDNEYRSQYHHQFHQSMFGHPHARSSQIAPSSAYKEGFIESEEVSIDGDSPDSGDTKQGTEERSYRKALAKGKSLQKFKFGADASALFLIAINLAILLTGLFFFFNSNVDNVVELQHRCNVLDQPFFTFSALRRYQHALSKDLNIEMAKETVDQRLYALERSLLEAVPVKTQYSSESDRIWVAPESITYIPVLNHLEKTEFTYRISNDSLFNMLQAFSSHFHNILANEDATKDFYSFDFLYLWLNTEVITDSIEKSCTLKTEEARQILNTKITLAAIMAVLVGIVFVADILVIAIGLFVVSKNQRSTLELFKLIPKNPISLIVSSFNYDEFSQLSQKDFETSRTQLEIPPWAKLLGWFFLAVLAQGIVTGFLTSEIIQSVQYSKNMISVVSSFSSSFKHVARIDFIVHEYAMQLHQPSSSLSEIPTYHLTQQDMINAKNNFNDFRFGTNDFQGIMFLEPELGEGMTRPACNDSSAFHCSSFDGLMREIFFSASAFISTDKTTPIKTESQNVFPALNVIQSYIYGDHPPLSSHYVNSTISENTKRETEMNLFFWITAPITVLIVLFGVRRSVTQLETQGQQIRQMLCAIPTDIIESVPAIKQFVLTGKNLSRDHFDKIKKIAAIRTESILAAAVDAVLVMNEKGAVNMFNHSAELMFGYEKQDVLGLHGENLFSEDTRPQLQRVIKHLVNKKHSSAIQELKGLRKDGSDFPVLVSMSIGVNSSGKTMLAAFCRDITINKKHEALLNHEMKRAEELLLNIFPRSVTERLKTADTSEIEIRDAFEDVTCLIADIVSFTKLSSSITSKELVLMLNELVNEFDQLTQKHGVEKIKTIGDAYFCVGGAPEKSYDHPQRIVEFAMDMLEVVKKYNERTGKDINIRIGIHTGPVIAGVFGLRKVLYDVLGDTVTITNLMESTSEAGRIQCSRTTYERVHDLYSFEERSALNLKDKGSITRYILIKKKSKSSERLDLMKVSCMGVIKENANHDGRRKKSLANTLGW